jgi:glycine/D-amino acid oxidase-like deaminating enzyme
VRVLISGAGIAGSTLAFWLARHGFQALYKAEGRLPSTKSPSARERALATWLTRRRQDHDQGTLSPTYSDGLKQIPGWEQRTRKTNDEARWNRRLHELTAYITAGNDWPRHKRTDTEEERVLGMWLHIQRMKYRRDELDQDKEAQLDTLLPNWREGRTRGRPPGSPNIRKGEAESLI